MQFGKKLKDLRADKTQEEVAAAVGVTKSTWVKYERDERIPRDEVKLRIANYFGKSVQEIFFDTLSTKSTQTKGGATL